MVPVAEVRLDVAGLGIILIGHAAKLIPLGSDFFSDNLSDADSIVDIFSEGELTGFGTGSPGIFLVRLYIGPPGEDELNNWGAGIELRFVTNDGRVEFRDLYNFCAGRRCRRIRRYRYVPASIESMCFRVTPNPGSSEIIRKWRLFLSRERQCPG